LRSSSRHGFRQTCRWWSWGKRSDPRVGEITYRLIGIKRADPPASLFEIPADYRVDGERR
jgi:hypothetical protein